MSASALGVTAQDFYDFEKCPHRVFLNHHGDPREKLPLSDFLNLLFERALLHEEDVVGDLPHLTPVGASLEEWAASTVELMQAGTERIYHGVLIASADTGIPDLLEKVVGKSNFGDYYYKPVDIKSGSGYTDEAKGKLRDDYGMQLYHYAMLLEAVQGTFPLEAEILNKRKERVAYPLPKFERAYRQSLPTIRRLVEGTDTDEPALVSSCQHCQWWGRCERILVERHDVTLLPGMGRSIKAKLNGAGIRSIRDIPNFDFAAAGIKGSVKRPQKIWFAWRAPRSAARSKCWSSHPSRTRRLRSFSTSRMIPLRSSYTSAGSLLIPEFAALSIMASPARMKREKRSSGPTSRSCAPTSCEMNMPCFPIHTTRERS